MYTDRHTDGHEYSIVVVDKPQLLSCYPCIKSTKFVRKIKVKLKFGGSWGDSHATLKIPDLQ